MIRLNFVVDLCESREVPCRSNETQSFWCRIVLLENAIQKHSMIMNLEAGRDGLVKLDIPGMMCITDELFVEQPAKGFES